MAADHQSATPRRVLMTADAVGGVWQYSLDLLSGITGENVEVLLAILGPAPSESQRAELSEISNVRLETGEFALEWMENPWPDVERAGEWLMRLAADFQPDVIHLNGYSHAALSWKLPRIIVAHSCVYSWWRAVRDGSPGPEWIEYKRRVKAGLSDCDAVVAPSRYMAGEISAEYDVPIERVRVIHNYSAANLPQIARKQPFILAAGRIWDEAKNIKVLTEAARDISWPICIAGESQFGNASARGLERVQGLGKLPHRQLLEKMAAAEIFAHPALYEPFGLSVLEAATMGCAVALSDIPPMHELWEDAALFVKPRDPGAWAAALNKLISDRALRKELGCSARRQALKYSRKQCIGSYMALYKDVLCARSGGLKEAAA